MKKILFLVAVMAIILWAPFLVVAQNQIQFDPYQIESSNESFWIISNGNVNGDNLTDLCLGSTTSPLGNNYQIKTFLQNPDPTIGLYSGYSFNYPVTPEGIVSMDLGDLNNDNLTDLVIAYADVVQIYFNNSGVLSLDTTVILGATVCDIAIGDISANGLTDIVVGTYSGLKFLMQHPNNIFLAIDYEFNNYGIGLSGLCSVELADVEGNGDLDIIWLSKSYLHGPLIGNIIIRQNGSLQIPYPMFLANPSNYSQTSLVATELNGDPGIDIAVAFSSSDILGMGEVAIWSSTDIWIFPYASEIINTNHGSQALTANDMNKDGLMDLIQIYNVNEVSVLTQNSEGEFSEACFTLPPSTNGYNPESMDVGDYNNDTLDDVAVADLEYGLVVLYQENTTTGLGTINSLPILKIFPNPVSDYFEINSTSSGQLEIIDFLGRTISVQKINHGINQVDCSSLIVGNYLIKVIDQTGIKQAKIIKR